MHALGLQRDCMEQISIKTVSQMLGRFVSLQLIGIQDGNECKFTFTINSADIVLVLDCFNFC